MRPIDELVAEDSAWPQVLQWLSNAESSVEILPPVPSASIEALLKLQITTRSPMGAVIYQSAGILIDSGWLRFLGSGSHPRMHRSLPLWNQGRADGFCIFADDAIGGYFALNGGAFGPDLGKVFYFAPDTLEWLGLDVGYSDFFLWSLTHSIEEFYADLRWSGWREEVSDVMGDEVLNFYPPLWAEGEQLNKRARRIVPATEQFDFQVSVLRQMGA